MNEDIVLRETYTFHKRGEVFSGPAFGSEVVYRRLLAFQMETGEKTHTPIGC